MKTILKMAIDTEYKMPSMPNFLIPDRAKSGTEQDVSIHIKYLTPEQAAFVANALAREFMDHWASFQEKEKS